VIIRLLTCPAIALDIDSVYWVTWIVSDKHNTEHTLPSHPNMGRKKAQHGSAKNQKENVPKTTTLQDKLSSLNDRLLACKYFNVEQLCIWISPEELTLLDRNEMRSVTIRWRVLWLWVWLTDCECESVLEWLMDGWPFESARMGVVKYCLGHVTGRSLEGSPLARWKTCWVCSWVSDHTLSVRWWSWYW